MNVSFLKNQAGNFVLPQGGQKQSALSQKSHQRYLSSFSQFSEK